jgi:hypothetical protein
VNFTTTSSIILIVMSISSSTMDSDTDSVIYTPSTSSICSDNLSQNVGSCSNPEYASWDSYPLSIDDCPCCSPSYSDWRIACGQESSNFPFDHPMPQDHADFRSSSRAKQRERKIRENKRGCNSYKCRKSGQAQQRTKNQKAKAENLKYGVRESQIIQPCYTRSFFAKTKHHFIAWDTRLEEEMDEWVYDMEDDVIRYITLRHGASAFESSEPYVEIGESFPVWAQRRIAEMRAVKESRIRKGEPEKMKQMVWRRRKDWRHFKKYDIYCGDERSTTLPTNAYDASGHEILRSILTPLRWYNKPQRVDNAPLFRPINNGYWFGEFAWAWHRNESGCWEIGYDTGCTKIEGDWKDGPIPCPHCCDVSPGMYYECFCRQCKCTPAPEEMQRCSLVEWVGEKGREIMVQDEAKEQSNRFHDVVMSEDDSDAGWDVVSIVSSETWSIIDSDVA